MDSEVEFNPPLHQNLFTMALIKILDKQEATGKVAEIYGIMESQWGMIPEAFSMFSTSPELMSVQFNNLNMYMKHATLSGKLLAFIRLVVSEIEDCKYCVGMNSSILMQYGVLPEVSAEVKLDPAKAPLDEKEKALLLFVVKVVKESNAVEAADVENLRSLGWDDKEILEASYHATSQVGADKLFNAFKINM